MTQGAVRGVVAPGPIGGGTRLGCDGAAQTEEQCRAALTAIEALVSSGKPDEAARAARRLLAEGPTHAPYSAEIALQLSSALILTGRLDDAAEVARRVRSRPLLPDRLVNAATATQLLAVLEIGDVGRVRDAIEPDLSGTSCSDDEYAGAVAATLTARAYIAWDEGRVLDALRQLRAAVCMAGTRQRHDAGACYPNVCLARVLVAVGDFESAALVIDTIEAFVVGAPLRSWAPVPDLLRSRLQLQINRYDEAAFHATRALQTAETVPAGVSMSLAHSTMAEVALARGDSEDARAHATRVRQCSSSGAGLGVAAPALVENYATSPRRSRDRRAVVAELCDSLVEHKRALVEEPQAVAWLIRVALDDRDRARAEHLAQAMEDLTTENPGLSVLRARASQVRALVDGHALRRRNRERPVTGWGSLTPHEQQVAALAADGFSNREIGSRMFLSRHTVDFHLRQVYRKLEVRSRVELARMVVALNDVA